MTLTIVCIILIGILIWDYLFFIVLAFPIRVYQKHLIKLRKRQQATHAMELISGTTAGYGQLKKKVRAVFVGLIRFFDIKIGYLPCLWLRHYIYRKVFLIKLGKDAIVHYGSEIRNHNHLSIGTHSIIGDRAVLDARNGIVIGENVNISSDVHIYTEQHDHEDPLFRCNSDESFRVKIGNRAWIGPRVTILHSVNIGEGAVIAAGAVVTKDIAPFAIAAGIPAKPIRQRNKELAYTLTDDDACFY